MIELIQLALLIMLYAAIGSFLNSVMDKVSICLLLFWPIVVIFWAPIQFGGIAGEMVRNSFLRKSKNRIDVKK